MIRTTRDKHLIVVAAALAVLLPGPLAYAEETRRRLVVFHLPNGLPAARWRPPTVGALDTLPAGLSALEPFRSRLTVVSGLRNTGAGATGRGFLSRSAASLLTGLASDRLGATATSLDARVATALQDASGPLVVGVGPAPIGDGCGPDGAESCAFLDTLSWTSPGVPLARETRPSFVRARVEGSASPRERRRLRLIETLERHAARPLLNTEYPGVPGLLVSAYERAAITSGQPLARRPGLVSKPTFPAIDPRSDVDAILGVLVDGLGRGNTHVATFMLGSVGWEAWLSFAGGSGGYGTLATPSVIEPPAPLDVERHRQRDLVDDWILATFAGFLQRLDAIEDGEGTLLDHTLVVLTSAVGERATADELPVLVVGAGDRLLSGAHHRFEGEPYARLLAALHEATTGDSATYGPDGATPLPILREAPAP